MAFSTRLAASRMPRSAASIASLSVRWLVSAAVDTAAWAALFALAEVAAISAVD